MVISNPLIIPVNGLSYLIQSRSATKLSAQSMLTFSIRLVKCFSISILVIVILTPNNSSASMNCFILWPRLRTMQRLAGRFDRTIRPRYVHSHRFDGESALKGGGRKRRRRRRWTAPLHLTVSNLSTRSL